MMATVELFACARAALELGGYNSLAAELATVERQSWAVRVLDAWADANASWRWYRCGRSVHKEGYACVLNDPADRTVVPFDGPTEDIARLAAAVGVFDSLPAEMRAHLGEAP